MMSFASFAREAASADDAARLLMGASVRIGDVTDRVSLARDGFRGERFDAMVSCLASRTGAPKDAWAVDRATHLGALAVAQEAGVTHIVLLSAICVQKPRLAFQHAKLAFEPALTESGLTYSIVRPAAYFKSLSGQLDRLRKGKPFLVFGDGALTACKPIGDDDIGRYIAECRDDEREPKFNHVPVALLDAIIAILATLGRVLPPLGEKAELARIARYYATESMLVLDAATGGYDAAATPSTGTETLFDFYARLVNGEVAVERGDHAVF